MPRRIAVASPLLLIAIALLLNGCAGYWAYREGEDALAEGRVVEGMTKLREAVDQSPNNGDYRRTYLLKREAAVNTLMHQAQTSQEGGDFDGARRAYEELQRIDPANERARQELSKLHATERQWKLLDAAQVLARKGDFEAAVARANEVLSESPSNTRASSLLKQFMRQQADRTGRELGIYPRLKEAFRAPVSLSFANANLEQAFDALKQASGLNYVFDRDVKTEARVMLSVTSKPVQDILRLLLATNQLDYRVLDDDTILIYPNLPAKQAEYKEMVVRTFYLRNADPNKMASIVKTIAKAKDVMVDEKLNLLVVRDSSEVIRLAEKLIAATDMPEPEVMLELEVMEVSVSRMLDMGITWPTSISASVQGAAGVAGQLTSTELRHFNSGLVKLNLGDPAAAAQLRSQVGSANLLANPRVRVRNRQSAKILIGERVPVFTTTATANVGTSESVNYLDVGLKLDLEPTITLDDEVSMKLALEVSNITQTITRASGTQAYRLGTRNTSTTLQVHDGETNVLAGLIQTEDRQSNTGIPGVNEIPLISKLFGSSQSNGNKTEIVLLVTPHVIRNVEPAGIGRQEFTAGTDASNGAAPIQLGAPEAAGRTVLPNTPNTANTPNTPNTNTVGDRPATPPRPVPPASSNTPGQALIPPPLVPSSPDPAGSAGAK